VQRVGDAPPHVQQQVGRTLIVLVLECDRLEQVRTVGAQPVEQVRIIVEIECAVAEAGDPAAAVADRAAAAEHGPPGGQRLQHRGQVTVRRVVPAKLDFDRAAHGERLGTEQKGRSGRTTLAIHRIADPQGRAPVLRNLHVRRQHPDRGGASRVVGLVAEQPVGAGAEKAAHRPGQ